MNSEIDYKNRIQEFEDLASKISNHDLVYVVAGKAYGITSFLQEFENRLEDKKAYYINALSTPDVGTGLLSQLDRTDTKKLQKSADKIWGEKSKSIINALLECIPYAGPFLSRIFESPKAAPVYTGNYSTLLEEALIPLFREHQLPTYIFVDSAEQINENSYNLIVNLAMISNVCIILAVADQNEKFKKLQNRISIYHEIQTCTVLFHAPEKHLVGLLCSAYGITLDNQKIEQLLLSTGHNIHLIIEQIRQWESGASLELTALAEAILNVLYICRPGLEYNILCEILRNTTVHTENEKIDVIATLKKLEQVDCILHIQQEEKQIWKIQSLNHPSVQLAISSYANTLYYKSIVYEYYAKLDADVDMSMLDIVYELSLLFSRTKTRMYARKLVESKLKRGEIIAPELFASAELTKRSNYEIIIAMLYYCRERNYEKALNWSEAIKGKKRLEYVNLHAIILNRLKRLEQANEELAVCVSVESDNKKLNILYSYYVANYIHLGLREQVEEHFNTAYQKLTGSQNHGYFSRNMASAFSVDEIEKKKYYYKRAIDNFEQYNDDFGLYSTMCNRGNSLCVAHRPQEALQDIECAARGLQQFGEAHLHIVYNDLGMCALMLKDYSTSEKYLSIAKSLAFNQMPLINVSINQACLWGCLGQFDRALDILSSVENSVIRHRVNSNRQKYFTNRLLIEYMRGLSYLQTYYRENQQLIEKYIKAKTLEHYQTILEQEKVYGSESWTDLYLPAGLAYWYVDPLKLI